jgi:hypothetical protein
MHYAGVKFISWIMNHLGILMCHELDPDQESYHFNRLTDWKPSKFDGLWDRPTATQLLSIFFLQGVKPLAGQRNNWILITKSFRI